MFEYIFQNPPNITDEMLSSCRKTKNYKIIAFEWLKYIGIICIKLANIDRNSPGVISRDEINYIILQGLLNRSARLTYSIVHLGSQNKFEETIRIIARCIVETLFTIKWLIKYSEDNSFKRYLRSSLDGDKEFWDIIETNIQDRSGEKLIIEERMLKSIKRSFSTAGMTKDSINQYRKMPQFRQICTQIGYGDLAYVTMMRMGSHAVHGTWSDLLANYLEDENGNLVLRDNDRTSPSENYYTSSSLFTIEALKDYIIYILEPHDSTTKIINELNSILDSVLQYRDESADKDYDTI